MTRKNRSIFCLILFAFLLSSFFLNGMEKMTAKQVLNTNRVWQMNFDTYRPDKSLLEIIREKVNTPLKVDVYLGVWCLDSQRYVPAFFKIVKELGLNNLSINFYNVGKKANKNVKYYVEKLKVERIPTFIFYRDGKEIGRIVEDPQKTLVEDFLEIIF